MPASTGQSESAYRLQRQDYARSTFAVARRLLGCTVCHRVGTQLRRGRIVEVEVYTDDPASHAANGKRTPRNGIMFGPPGFAYIYFTYGMHHCFNVVSEREGRPGAVLIRGLDGLGHAAGPGLTCQALQLTRRDNGRDLVTDPDLWIESGQLHRGERIVQTTRIGIRHAAELRRRLYILGSPGVSRRDRRAERP
ncbi:MAG: DNA-3-methyladenine glycosylase [Candidatus Binatia bacterium]